jgi:hypothetical protein
VTGDYAHITFQIGPQKVKSDFLENGSNSVEYISVIYGDHHPKSGVGKLFWVLPQNIFVYNDITP